MKRFVVATLVLQIQWAWAADVTLGEMTVTGTREGQQVAETAASVSVIKPEAISELKARHPGELMGKVPGVHVNVTGGEGHMAAIRQPITTNPVYLYLEDGIPTRSTGFFNHNALYEINLPQAGGVEVTRGSGSALYGSDAIGGVVNVLTRTPPLQPELSVSVEAGQHGWKRALISGGQTTGDNAYRADLNLTDAQGWRDATAYDRQSASLRWDRGLANGALLKTVLTASQIDQQTAGTSAISRHDFENNPTLNYTPISFRKVSALRLSSAYEQAFNQSLLSITPYARYNSMDMIPNWSLSYEPQYYESDNYSLGLLTKYRVDFAPWRTRLVTGADVDYSPGHYRENSLTVSKTGKIFSAYTTGAETYHYDVAFTGVAPYLHLEASPSDQLRLEGGLRFDYIRYDYNNNLSELNTGRTRRPASTDVEYSHISPKLGASYAFSPRLNGFASYRNSFRAPSQNQLFRQGQAINTVDLKPVDADSVELGLRGQVGQASQYQLSLYRMKKTNDIVSYTNQANNTRETQNAGETSHQGLELGFSSPLTNTLQLDASYSYAKHRYENWNPRNNLSYNGNEISSAPRQIGDLRLNWRPTALNGGRMELNWVHLGGYWLDDENTQRYAGHDLLHLRGNYRLNPQWEVFGQIENLTDKRYATSASYTTTSGEQLAPGLPRTGYLGVQYLWK